MSKKKISMFCFLILVLTGGEAFAQGSTKLTQPALEQEVARLKCNCKSIRSTRECKKRTIKYYIDLPSECKPIGMSFIDGTCGRALWDRNICTGEDFSQLDAEAQRRARNNDNIIGVETGMVYKGKEVNSTTIRIERRGNNKNKWILELSSCCHTIPTLRVSVKCPGSKYVKNIYFGLYYDEKNRFRLFGKVEVDGKRLTLENYNSFYKDCSLPYCFFSDRSNPDSLGSNGEIKLYMVPDANCKFDITAFRNELYLMMKKSGCYYKSTHLIPKKGIMAGHIFTNKCTPHIVDCIKRLLKKYTDCKEVKWIGRQIRILPIH